MLFNISGKKLWTSFIVSLLLLCAYGPAVAGEDEMTIDDYINAASPYLHHSCETAWAASGEDEDKYIEMINTFVAIMFINHSFDMSHLTDVTQEQQDELQLIFYSEIGKRCTDTPQRLLSSITEQSLLFAFDEMKAKIQ